MKWITALLTLLILAVIILADLGMLPVFLHGLYDFPSADKAGHFALYGMLNYLLTLTVLRTAQNRTPARRAMIAGLALGGLIALEEASQKCFTTRTPDPADLTASLLGLIIGGFAAVMRNKKRPSQDGRFL